MYKLRYIKTLLCINSATCNFCNCKFCYAQILSCLESVTFIFFDVEKILRINFVPYEFCDISKIYV